MLIQAEWKKEAEKVARLRKGQKLDSTQIIIIQTIYTHKNTTNISSSV